MRSFRSLSTRLTVQFALLFAGVMLAVSAALSTFIASAALQQVRGQLQFYDRLWHQRSRELQTAAHLLARDFGFRAAVASGDEATIQSVLRNAAARLHVPTAFIVSTNGRVSGIDPMINPVEAARLWEPLDEGRLTGVAVLSGSPRQLVAAPLMAPTLIGWVVFAANLDEPEMRSLERLSAIPLHAVVLADDDGRWAEAAGSRPRIDGASARLVEKHVGSGAAFEMRIGGKASIALAKRLPTFSTDGAATLLLAHPKSQALRNARELQWALAVLTLLGLLVVVIATWRSAGRITQPLKRLAEAAQRLASGAHVQVQVRGRDELARLAASFNEMVGKIAQREQRISQLAFTDALTGLPNRAMFQQQLEHLLRVAEGSEGLFAIHYLDLDEFKAINDALGHPAGDALLVAAGQRLTEAAGGHFVARLGGDEFVVLQTISGDRKAIEDLARAILRTISRPLAIDGSELVPSTSIGIAIAPLDGAEGDTLLKNADLALYRAKADGRGTFAFFEESLNERAQERRQLETDLRLAIEHGQFELHYQPLFDLKLNRICSFEALIRWNHPLRGMISPLDFIPVAEDNGLIVPIGAWVVREACQQAMTWPEHVHVAVNVSPVQFHRGGLQKTILSALAESGLAPSRLEIEITESVFLEDSDANLKLLHSLRELGVRVALDDFGTGYSSLSYLQSFPFDKLKIDRSFIQDLLTRDGGSAIVRAITALAQALGIETTAEGVEETAQLLELHSQGCSSVQGFLFAEPMSVADLDGLFEQEALALQNVA